VVIVLVLVLVLVVVLVMAGPSYPAAQPSAAARLR
jgi:hypothetical protein